MRFLEAAKMNLALMMLSLVLATVLDGWIVWFWYLAAVLWGGATVCQAIKDAKEEVDTRYGNN